jgi:carboxyl-terminal processing protease
MMIPEFDEITVSQFEQTLSGLAEEGMESLIVDVRDNPGGLLDTVTAILDDLLDECVLLTTRTREGEGDRISAKDGTLFSGQIVVMVNEYSASAAEVFSGVLQHYDKAVIIGQDTYGKGTVQKTYSLRDGSAFKLTTEAYAIAGETEIDGKGIVPDLYVEEEDAGAQEQEDVVLARALEYLKEQGA